MPKISIRQKHKAKPPETLIEFRTRLQEHLEASEIKFVEVPYVKDSVTDFIKCCNIIRDCKEFPKNPTRLCGWCPYQKYCESNGEIDYMIL